MSATQRMYRLVCWYRDRVVSVSAPVPRDTAFGLFRECVSSGRYAPFEPGRAVVLSEEEYAKHARQEAA